MLNPGSCNNNQVFNEEISVLPDPTLNRIKGLMQLFQQFQWVQVLNLSDIQNPKSEDFFEEVEKLRTVNYFSHSIFHPDRRNELKNYVKPHGLIYFACGINDLNRDLIKEATEALEELNAIIINKGGKYYHPLVRPNKEKNIENWKLQVIHALQANSAL